MGIWGKPGAGASWPRLHNINSLLDHQGAGGVLNNLIAFNSSGLFKDSGNKISDIVNSIENVIQIHPTKPVIAGERYQDIPTAQAWIAANSPATINNIWAIKTAGNYSGNFTVQSWIIQVFERNSQITGSINSAGGITTDFDEFLIVGGILSDIKLTGSNGFRVENVTIKGSSSTGGGLLAVFNSLITAGDFSNISQMSVFGSVTLTVGGTVTFPTSLEYEGERIQNSAGTINLNGCSHIFGTRVSGVTWGLTAGYNFEKCTIIDSGTINFSSQSIIFDECRIKADIQVTGSSSVTVNGGSVSGSAFNVNGGALTTRNISTENFTYTSGTWTNLGNDYDNRSSGISATDDQGAIDEMILTPPNAKQSYKTGEYYDAKSAGILTNGLTTYAVSSGNFYCTPFFVDKQNTFDRVWIEKTAGIGTGAKARLGIYEDNLNRPGNLITDFGEITNFDVNTTYEIIINETFKPGKYWLCLMVDTNRTIRAHATVEGRSVGDDGAGGITRYPSVSGSQSYGAMPDPAPTTNLDNNNIPRIQLRST